MSSAHYFLRIENQSNCYGVVRLRFLISHTFQRKRYIIVRIVNLLNVCARSRFACLIMINSPQEIGRNHASFTLSSFSSSKDLREFCS